MYSYLWKTYYFARDDRVWRAFKERLDTHQNEIGTKLSKRLRWQIRVLCKVLENRSETLHVSVVGVPQLYPLLTIRL